MAPTAEKTAPVPPMETPAEPERIALRSTLPPAPVKPAPKLHVPDLGEVVPPRNPFADLAPEPAKAPVPKVEAKPTNRITEVAAPLPEVKTSPVSAALDRDLDRAYFPSRSMIPEFTLLGVVTAGWIWGVMPWLGEFWQSPEVIASVPGTYAAFLAVQWLFGIIGGGYRLTSTELLRINAGPIPDPEPIDLTRIAGVSVELGGFDWFLCVGQVRIKFERETEPDVVLGPLSWPRQRAKLIEKAVDAARESSVTAVRLAA